MLKYLDKKLIVKIVEEMSKKEDLEYMINLVCENTDLIENKAEFSEKIFAREELGTTGIGRAVAVPHARCEDVKDIVFSVALLKNPISDYLTPDSENPKIVILVGAPKSKNSEYLKLLSNISKWFRNKENRDNIMLSKDRDELIVELLNIGE